MAGKKINPWLKAGLEFGPLLAFFIAFSRLKTQVFTVAGTEYSGFILATAIFVPLLVASTLVLWRLTGRLAAMQIATLVLVIVFGGLTIWLNDPRFLKMKVTIIYLLFAGILGLGMALGKSWLALVMDEVLPLTAEGWRILTWRLIAFFLGLAVLNEVIWRTMSDQAWVNFKTFGLSVLVFAFFMAQTRLFARHAVPKDE
ncbi:inner membrane-spanning protein YciB [Phaeovulum sp.]|uniref:inner membrane-spanning protein YciB n=1 Tax=Phaeovulum sp. TaxID=2934796 RepID=UPI0035641535